MLYLLSFTSIFMVEGEKFYQGKGENVIIGKEGVRTGYAKEPVADTLGSFVSSIIETPYGIFVGTGEKGEIFLIKTGKTEKVYEEEGFAVIGKLGRSVIAGISPGGKILKYSGGKFKEWIKLDVEYIWCFLPYKDGVLVGTGPHGKIFFVDKKGNIKEFMKLDAENVISLYRKEKLYATTQGPGLLWDLAEKRVIFDPGIAEVKGVVEHNGTLYVAGVTENLEGYLFMLCEGRIDTVYHGEPIYSITEWKGKIFIGGGKGGKVGMVKKDFIEHVADFNEGQVTSLYPGEFLLAGTGNDGKLYRLKPAKEGHYDAPVFDGKPGAYWGRVEIEGKGSFSVFYRTGEREKPDTTWTEWKRIKEEIGVTSRFLQIRVGVGKDAWIRKIKVSAREKNSPPVIKSLLVLPPGVGFGEGKNSPWERRPLSEENKKRLRKMGFEIKEGSYTLPPSLRCITWEVTDPDGDPVKLDLYIKKEKEKNWEILESSLQGNSYFFDDRLFPDGYYEIKLVATDAPGRADAETSEKEAKFLIDRTPPYLKSLKIKNGRIEGEVEDALSPVEGVFYTPDGINWYAAAPEDGVFDEKREKFYFDFNGKRVLIKLSDWLGNFVVVRREIE